METATQTPIGHYKPARAICEAYDPRAPKVAQLVARLIGRQSPRFAVEHIGSTAVEGCAGKGIVDLMILYPDGLLEPAKQLLERLGFQRQSGRDPWPESRPMRVGSIDFGGTIFSLHAHVISAQSNEATNLLRFRDRLREDPMLREKYVARKRDIIARGVTDPVDYSIAKGEFVTESLVHCQ